jgi:hypothetical protein
MAFASVRDFMMMILGSGWHRDRGTRECGGANRACQRTITGRTGREQRRDPAGGCVMVEVDIYEGLENI